MLIGKILSNRYKILEPIGGGGMAKVFKAYDAILDRVVAVKILRPELTSDEEFIKRFHREAQSATSLVHPNIVNVFDVGVDGEYYYIVMEYVDGTTLKKYIQQHGPLPAEQAIQIMKQITSAIEHAHENNIIHRDIKPHNILLDENGNAKVTDFGIAIAMSQTTITHTHAVMGSVHYLSPEQARGGIVDRKSDIYSLGIVLFEMVTGQIPFNGDSAVSIALKHLQEEIPLPTSLNPNLPQSVENIILKAVNKDPSKRYERVADLEADLSTALLPERLHEAPYQSESLEEEETKILPMTELKQKSQAPVKKEPENDKNKLSKKRQNKKKWFITAIIIVAIILISLPYLPKFFYVKDVVVPNVTGLNYDDAYRKLMNLGLVVKEKEFPNSKVKEGKVYKQDPGAKEVVKENSTVTLYVSTGKKKVKMDNYVGKDKDVVEELLQDAGYKNIEWIPIQSGHIPENQITSQYPKKGTDVIPDETTVFLRYNTGAPTVVLGNLVGMTKSQVDRYIQASGLKVKYNEDYSETQPAGQVSAQSPEANVEVEKGSTISVTLSKGPNEKPIRVNQKITIDVSEEDGNVQGHHVQIFYLDASHPQEEVFADDQINETKTYLLPLLVERDKPATYRVLLDGKETRNQTIDYNQAKENIQ